MIMTKQERIDRIHEVLNYINNLTNPTWESDTEKYYLEKELENLLTND